MRVNWDTAHIYSTNSLLYTIPSFYTDIIIILTTPISTENHVDLQYKTQTNVCKSENLKQ